MTASSHPGHNQELAYATGDIAGIGGRMKLRDEDFIVEEVPLYDASGKGTHVYFTIEKQGLTTPAAIRSLAKALNRQRHEFGYAGLKDAHGITRQRLSLEHVEPQKITSLSIPRVRIKNVEKHTNKIKLGHLQGNRFHLRIRDVGPDAERTAGEVLTHLQTHGVPNYFGPQRFGVRNDNVDVGLAVLREEFDVALSFILGRPHSDERPDIQRARKHFDDGQHEAGIAAWPNRMSSQQKIHQVYFETGGNARKAWRAVDQNLRRLFLSAVQSQIFNEVLASRISEYHSLQTGDVAWKHANGSCFLVEDQSQEMPRCEAFEISATGPLPGRKMKDAAGEIRETELSCMRQLGLLVNDAGNADVQISPLLAKLDGARRPLRVPLQDASLSTGSDDDGAFLALQFELPAGSYATSVTREICKDTGRYHRLKRFRPSG